ncbi:toxin-antitoxin system YwqK family antitoxin [Polaribacter sp. Asnod6-C07]|uniref:toxin-antitoxin system YwqK family antitoxin n=1 Tax=Polaribacter sp. Asnod6-C07 TaxID=3160582 RepID=UPI00386376D5
MRGSTLILGFIVIFLTSSFTVQETVWLDKNLKVTSQAKAVYYKIGNKRDGSVSYFYKSKTVYRKTYFVDGKLDGKFNEYYASGNLKVDGKYKNGTKDGNWKTYYKNGKIKSKGRYKDGEKVGIWKFFYKND